MSSLTEQIKDIQKHIQVKQKRIEQANGIQNFKPCDQLSEEVVSLKEKRREAEATLRILKSKKKKSDQYFTRKIYEMRKLAWRCPLKLKLPTPALKQFFCK